MWVELSPGLNLGGLNVKAPLLFKVHLQLFLVNWPKSSRNFLFGRHSMTTTGRLSWTDYPNVLWLAGAVTGGGGEAVAGVEAAVLCYIS